MLLQQKIVVARESGGARGIGAIDREAATPSAAAWLYEKRARWYPRQVDDAALPHDRIRDGHCETAVREQLGGCLLVGQQAMGGRIAQASEQQLGRAAGQGMPSTEDLTPDERLVGPCAGGQAVAEQAPRRAMIEFGSADESLDLPARGDDRGEARHGNRRSPQARRYISPEARRAAVAQTGVPP